MSNTNDFNAQAQNLPPRPLASDVEKSIFSAVTGAAAASADIWAGYTADAGGIKSAAGKCWLELEAVGFPVYVRFCATALTATTSSNGAVLQVAVPRRFYVDPTKDLFLDHLATGVGVLKWRRVGAICERSRA